MCANYFSIKLKDKITLVVFIFSNMQITCTQIFLKLFCVRI